MGPKSKFHFQFLVSKIQTEIKIKTHTRALKIQTWGMKSHCLVGSVFLLGTMKMFWRWGTAMGIHFMTLNYRTENGQKGKICHAYIPSPESHTRIMCSNRGSCSGTPQILLGRARSPINPGPAELLTLLAEQAQPRMSSPRCWKSASMSGG